MTDSTIKNETRIIFVDNYTYEVTHLFNGNAFPETLKEEIDACVTRMVIFRRNARDVCAQVSRDFATFQEQLNDQIQMLQETAINKPEQRFTCYHDNTHYISAICSALIYLKSFLDVYSALIVKSINPSQKLLFSKAVVDGETKQIAGGKLINWLRRCAPAQHTNLSNIILTHSKDWIHQAVTYRDTLIHYGELPELRRMRVPLRPESPPFRPEEIEAPKMPHGDDVQIYVRDLAERLHGFLQETVPSIPNVKLELVDFREFPLDTN